MGGSPSLKFKSLQKLQSTMIDYNLVDIWRTRNPNLRQFTWRRTNPVIMRRLDFLKISNELQYDVKSCMQLTPVRSVHSPIVLHISSMSELTRGKGYWKFNNCPTADKDFVEKLRTYINDVKSTFNGHQDSRINWEFLKYKIRRFSNRYTLEQAENEKQDKRP